MNRWWLRFRDLPLRRKLSLLMALAAAVALVFSAVPLIAYAWIKARDSARLDLDYPEDVAADVDMNVVMSSENRFVEVQGTGEHGTFNAAELEALLGTARCLAG